MQVSRQLLRAVGRAARHVGELRRTLIEAVGGAASGFHLPDQIGRRELLVISVPKTEAALKK